MIKDRYSFTLASSWIGIELAFPIVSKVKKNFIDKKTYSFNKNLSPLKVHSAFGGFGIYKMKYVQSNKKKYEGTQTIDLIFKDNTKKKVKFQRCEHVNFNFGLKESIQLIDGQAQLPTKPGLGIDLDWDFIENSTFKKY